MDGSDHGAGGTVKCPGEHEEVGDRCDANYHKGGTYDSKRNSGFCVKRAAECDKRVDLEEAFANWSFAIHAARTENDPGPLSM